MKTVVTLVAVAAAILYAMDAAFRTVLPRNYVFDPAVLQTVCQTALESLDSEASGQEIMDKVYEGLVSEYPDYISKPGADDWVFNNAGNAMGSMLILHASLTEYLIFFGTAVGTEGHTGSHYADDYFTILRGQQLAAFANASTPEVYLPGDQHHLVAGNVKQYSMPSGAWALELAQGYIPSMLPFGLVEMCTSTLDYKSFGKTAYLTAKHMVANIAKGKY